MLNVFPQIEHKTDEIKFTCVECDYKTKTKSSIEKHVKSIHEPDTRDVQMICGICTHEFILEEDYNIHVKTHDGQESQALQTNLPNTTLNQDNISIENLLIEPSIEETKNEATLDESITAVVKNDKNEQNYKHLDCAECGFVFTDELDLNCHINMNHKKQAGIQILLEAQIEQNQTCTISENQSCESCPFCNLKFKSLDILKTHIENSHINGKTKQNEHEEIKVQKTESCTKCDLCDFRGNKSEMNKHVTNKHGINFACIQCGNTFPDKATLEKHIKSAHTESEPFPCEI